MKPEPIGNRRRRSSHRAPIHRQEGWFMRRIVLTLAAAAVLTFATALPVASFGLTDVTVNCDDGTSFSATVDLATLTGLTDAIQSMTLYPAELSCALIQAPAYRALGGIA